MSDREVKSRIEAAIVQFFRDEGASVEREDGDWFVDIEDDFCVSDLVRCIADELEPIK